MSRCFVIAAVALALSAAGAQAADTASVEATLIQLEKDSWVAWQGHDGRFFDRFLSDDHIEVGIGGPSGKTDVVAGVSGGGCVVASYRLDRFKVRQLDDGTAVLTYWADQTTHCGEAKVPSPVWATSMYQKRGGRWLNVLYVQSPIGKAG